MAFRAMRALACAACPHEEPTSFIDWQPDDDYGPCPKCSGRLRFKPEGFVTDVFGSPQYSDAAGCYVTSSRERDRIMRNVVHPIGDSGFVVRGFEPSGDKVHGARPELSIKNTGFSFDRQGSRTSAGERALSRTTSRAE